MKSLLLATAIVLAAPLSHAALVITTPTSPITLSNNTDPSANSLEINLNADAVADVRLTVVYVFGEYALNVVAPQGVSASDIGYARELSTFGISGQLLVRAFSIGGSVDSSLTFSSLAPLLDDSDNQGIAHWSITPDAYMGVRFKIGAATHYGWVHVVWDAANRTATVDSYAYEDVAGAAAIINPIAVPEPTVLPLLGLVGFAAFSRRRR